MQQIKKNLENNWIQFLKKYARKLERKDLSGSSPPSVFVGHYGYPKIKIGPLLPPIHGNTNIFDNPEKWLGKSLNEIVGYRSSLVRGVDEINIHKPNGRYIESLQELAMTKLPSESEMVFKKIPIIDMDKGKKIDTDFASYGLSAPLESFKISSSLSIDKRLESAFYNKDIHATELIFKLYEKGVEVSKISRILSMGMLGLQKNRILVPTRWSIAATDDIISSKIAEKLEGYNPIEFFEVFQYSHLGNNYSIILIPHNNWFLEMREAWIDNKGNIFMGNDSEDAKKLNHHPSLAGAFFSARLAVSEYLYRVKRIAAAMVLREIHPQYAIPVGVWQVREGMREAFRKAKNQFDNFDMAFAYTSTLMSVSKNEWLKNSKINNKIIKQKRIFDYM